MRRGASRRTFTTLLAAAILAASAGSVHAGPPGVGWNDVCYVGFTEHVERLAGADAVDCGLHRSGTTKHHAAVRRCMHKALKAGRAYKVGQIDADGPTDSCRVVVEGRALLPVYLWYFRDSPMWNSGKGRVWVQRCHDVVLPDKPGDVRLFDTDDCVDAHGLLPDLFASPSGQDAAESSAAVRALPP